MSRRPVPSPREAEKGPSRGTACAENWAFAPDTGKSGPWGRPSAELGILDLNPWHLLWALAVGRKEPPVAGGPGKAAAAAAEGKAGSVRRQGHLGHVAEPW